MRLSILILSELSVSVSDQLWEPRSSPGVAGPGAVGQPRGAGLDQAPGSRAGLWMCRVQAAGGFRNHKGLISEVG